MGAVVKGTSSPEGHVSPIESICGKDERVQVDPMTSPPYKWICFLSIKSTSDKWSVGSGFKIHLPGVNRTAIVTAGHCTYVDGAYAAKIRVKFPGQATIVVSHGNNLYAAPEYIDFESEHHDYGLDHTSSRTWCL